MYLTEKYPMRVGSTARSFSRVPLTISLYDSTVSIRELCRLKMEQAIWDNGTPISLGS